jgi:hypothetical protein
MKILADHPMVEFVTPVSWFQLLVTQPKLRLRRDTEESKPHKIPRMAVGDILEIYRCVAVPNYRTVYVGRKLILPPAYQKHQASTRPVLPLQYVSH